MARSDGRTTAGFRCRPREPTSKRDAWTDDEVKLVEDPLTQLRTERNTLIRVVDDVARVWSSFAGTARLGVSEADETEGLIAEELAVVRDALARQRLNVGLFGLIKRGKSTLLNALIGADVSATAVTPETAVPVYVEHGPEPSATVHFAEGRVEETDLDGAHRFTSQKTNRNNRLGVTHVRVRVPAPLLAAGTRLIDTPGLDDAEVDNIFTERTIQELDSVDVGLVVVLSTLSIGATETGFLREVVARASDKVILVVNMYPQHYYDDDARADIVDYVTKRVEEHVPGGLQVLPVCALDAWEATRAGFAERWQRSGAAELLQTLEAELCDGAGREVLAAAAVRLGHAIDLAEREVRTRRDLLADPAALDAYRDGMRRKIALFAGELQSEVEARLGQVEPLRAHHRSVLLSIFYGAKQRVRDVQSTEELEEVLKRFRREAEVAGNHASQQFFSAMGSVLDELKADIGERSEAVMAGLAADLDQHTAAGTMFEHLDQDGVGTAVGGAAFGALLAGGVGFAVVGAALGPLGLVGGALVGWRLGDVLGSGRELQRARELAMERLDALADELGEVFDRKVDVFVEAVREATSRRPRGLRADLERQLAAIEEFDRNPELLAEHRADYERLLVQLTDARERMRAIAPTPVRSA
jgi:hypothetical protein